MARSKTTWKPGASPNPSGRPKSGEGILRTLVAEFHKNNNDKKLAANIVKQAINPDADWRLVLAVYDFIYKLRNQDDLVRQVANIERFLEGRGYVGTNQPD